MKDATTDLTVGSPMCGGRRIPPGQTARVLAQEFSQRSFTGQLVHTASALDPASRTLLTEVQVSNRDVTLLPGMYAQVKFVITRANPLG